MVMKQDVQDYLFDINGYFTIENAITLDQRLKILQWVEEHSAKAEDAAVFERDEQGKWIGNVEIQTYMGKDGVNYQNIIEGGNIFEEMIDNPNWIYLIKRYIGEGLDGKNICLNESLINVRESGGYIGLHSGGHLPHFITQFHHTNLWNVGQLNVITALEDIGPGDGATTIVPGSHKAIFPHPHYKRQESNQNVVNYSTPAGDAENMIELYLKAGDSLVFTDGVAHGSSERVNPGTRKIMLFRYCPAYISTRWNYIHSNEFINGLTPERRQIIQPVKPRYTPGFKMEMRK